MKRNARRLNYLDYIIIGSLLFFVIGLYSRYTMRAEFEKNGSSVTADVVFEIRAVSEETVMALLSDTTLYDEHGELFGTVMVDSVSATPAVMHKVGADGALKEVTSKSLSDVEAVAVCRGAPTDAGFFLRGTTYIAPNMILPLRSGCGSFNIYLTDIEVF